MSEWWDAVFCFFFSSKNSELNKQTGGGSRTSAVFWRAPLQDKCFITGVESVFRYALCILVLLTNIHILIFTYMSVAYDFCCRSWSFQTHLLHTHLSFSDSICLAGIWHSLEHYKLVAQWHWNTTNQNNLTVYNYQENEHEWLCKQLLWVCAITESGGQLPQEESVKSDKDEGHLPVGPVQLSSQRKP